MLVSLLLSLAVASEPQRIQCSSPLLKAFACVETRSGVVVASNRADADRYVGAATKAEELFEQRFGFAVAPYAVLVGTEIEKVSAALNDAGVETLPWLTEEQRIAAGEASLRRAVENMAKERGLSPAQTEATLNSTLLTARSRAALLKDEAILPHELGHIWFIRKYWPSNHEEGYGGPAPDWLDEAAAVLLEDERLTENRRQDFREIRNGTNRRIGIIDNLPYYLQRAHPMAALASKLSEQVNAGQRARVGVITGPDVTALGVQSSQVRGFYAQTRVFLDFLLERSGNPRVVGSVAESIARGGTFESWLAHHGARSNLGSTLDELNRLWSDWIPRRYPEAPVPAT